jgi:acyl-CoA thioesterase FadM
LQIETYIINKTATTITMKQIITNNNSQGQTISTIEVLLVCVNKEFKAQKILLNLD